MQKLLATIQDKYWEGTGLLVGFSASVFISAQIMKELTNPGSTSLSFFYVFGFLLIYLFWFLYGVRYKRIAIWLSNAFASILQIILLIITIFN
jgi:hypothetical protein